MVYKLCLLGATNKQIAGVFNVAESTIDKWIQTHEGFSGAMKKGKTQADAEIAESLYHRAKGYSHPEDKILAVALGGNMGSEVQVTPTIKHYPPDTAAAFIWLKNRAGWRDKQEVKHEGNISLTVLSYKDADSPGYNPDGSRKD